MAIDVEAYYKKYGPMVLRRCRFLLKNEERALDAMQEVFVNLLKNCSTLKDAYPSSLLYRMATNICLNIIRSSQRRPELAGDELLMNIAAADDSEERLMWRSVLDFLFQGEKATTRDMMVMLYVDHMTLEEVAHAVGMSVSGVRKRVREFRAKVQGCKGVQP
ncbi:sigma-70 family RNA polymerase sigma factor [candidate division FCPU426 bacterium]|nr:sigma-70 family RNA polymerase sigma factor [candidate division FCPU426 bacterium]